MFLWKTPNKLSDHRDSQILKGLNPHLIIYFVYFMVNLNMQACFFSQLLCFTLKNSFFYKDIHVVYEQLAVDDYRIYNIILNKDRVV